MRHMNQESAGQFQLVLDRRSEPREPAHGNVLFTLEDGTSEFGGLLLDVSSQGFRIEHDRQDIRSGQIVVTTLTRRTLRARVMWNRVVGDRVESGLRWL